MKCPNCGERIAEGSLYCTKCGEDIHIVPDFEPELDNDIQQTIQNIADNIWNKEKADVKETKSTAKSSLVLTIIFMVIVLIILGVAAKIWTSNSVNYQLNKARESILEGEYLSANRHYMRAMALDEGNVALMEEYANVCFEQNDKAAYEDMLNRIIQSENASTTQLKSAYGKLIAIYRNRDDIQAIDNLLLASDNEEILSAYQGYVVKEPEFSVQEGFYNSIQPLRLSTYGTAQIYYTMDGSEPDENSTKYTMPILLDGGEYLIKAIAIGDKGIRSNVVKKEYHVTIEELKAPEISVMTGDYEFPVNIEILDEGEPVYYTMDGTTPTEHSKRYTGPIPMPVGKSQFQFIRIGNGRYSEVEKRDYHLKLRTEFTMEDAIQEVVRYCIETGKIDKYYHFLKDPDVKFSFEYQYVTNINGVNDFYIIKERFQDGDKPISDTGIYYAVNIYTMEIFDLQMNGTNYNLVEIERESP